MSLCRATWGTSSIGMDSFTAASTTMESNLRSRTMIRPGIACGFVNTTAECPSIACANEDIGHPTSGQPANLTLQPPSTSDLASCSQRKRNPMHSGSLCGSRGMNWRFPHDRAVALHGPTLRPLMLPGPFLPKPSPPPTLSAKLLKAPQSCEAPRSCGRSVALPVGLQQQGPFEN